MYNSMTYDAVRVIKPSEKETGSIRNKFYSMAAITLCRRFKDNSDVETHVRGTGGKNYALKSHIRSRYDIPLVERPIP